MIAIIDYEAGNLRSIARAIEAAGGRLVRCPVGDRYVVETLRAKGYNFGGEQSGHLVFLDHATTGDGLVGALQLLSLLVQSGRPLSELTHEAMERVPQILLNQRFEQRRDVTKMAATQKAIGAVEKRLGKKGRVLVRWSGTEPKLRVMLEGPSFKQIDRLARDILAVAKDELATAAP